MAMSLIVVRHGQTAWNKEGRFRGRTDLPLDETGLKQVEAAATRIAAEYGPEVVYAGPLQRTMQTAGPIARLAGLEVEQTEGLIDVDYGDFSGLSPAEAEERFPGLYRAWLESPGEVVFPNGGSLEAVRGRAVGLVYDIAGRHTGGRVAMVTHLVVCRVLLCSLLGIGFDHFWSFRVDTASLTIFEVDEERAVLLASNDTCHLRPIHGGKSGDV